MPLSSSSAQHAARVLAARLRKIRTDAGMTGRDLAELAGWHPSKVSRIENARRTPSTAELVSGHLTITQPHEIGMYSDVFTKLASLAVYGRAARGIITSAVAALDE